tara:strand:- start:1308 stop:2411 length:1104 start_codon:yes stop_codon:yes gene_type:complete
MERLNCVICDNNKFEYIYEINMPISLAMCNVSTQNTSTMSFVECSKCKTIQIKNVINLSLLYNKNTNHNSNIIGTTWINHYKQFINFFGNVTTKKNILEIGSSSDKILKNIHNYQTYTIVDPSIEEYHFSSYVVDCVKKLYEEYNTDKKFDLIISSHFFEHVYAPIKILHKMKEMLSQDGSIIMSIPNLEDYNNTFLGLHFEHTYHLNSSNMRVMCMRTGLRIEQIEKYKNHSVFYKITHNDNQKCTNSILNAVSFSEMFTEQINEMVAKIDSFNSFYDDKNNYFIFGCHFRTQAYLHMGLNPKYFEYILDNDTNKQNKYFYGTELECKSVDILKSYDRPIVFVDIATYTNEVKKQLIDSFPNVTII